jgi:hypothetical protein
MAKLASLTGYTPGSASVTFGNIKRKLKQLGEGLAADGPATPKNGARKATGTTPKSSKRGATEDPTPSKRAKKTPAKKARDDTDDDDDEHFIPHVKKEEVADLNESALGLYGQLNNAAAGYESSEQPF